MSSDKKKTYSLTSDEVSNLVGRREIVKFWDYTAKIILAGAKEDINNYVDDVIKKRLSIPEKETLQVDLEKGTATIDGKQDK